MATTQEPIGIIPALVGANQEPMVTIPKQEYDELLKWKETIDAVRALLDAAQDGDWDMPTHDDPLGKF